MHPAWSPDSGRLAFVSDREGGEHVWVLGFREGTALGEPAQLTSGDGTDYFPAWSPDGSLVAFRRVRRDASEVWVVPSAGGGPARRVLAEGARYVRWAPTGDSLLVSVTPDSPGLALLRVSAATGRAEPVKLPVSLDDADPIGNFDVSRDQRYLAFTEEQLRGDIWLLEMERRPF
jgi:dipeptidyl aminopeptidase/acylaminoacyl peptidase